LIARRRNAQIGHLCRRGANAGKQDNHDEQKAELNFHDKSGLSLFYLIDALGLQCCFTPRPKGTQIKSGGICLRRFLRDVLVEDFLHGQGRDDFVFLEYWFPCAKVRREHEGFPSSGCATLLPSDGRRDFLCGLCVLLRLIFGTRTILLIRCVNPVAADVSPLIIPAEACREE